MGKRTVLGILLIVVIYGLGFAILNRFVLGLNLSERTTQPALVATDLILREFDSFSIPQLTITLSEFSDVPPENGIPFEEAALIGARYIWEILGVSLDEAEIVIGLGTEFGEVAWNGFLLEQGRRNYSFSLFAETGELMNIANWYRPSGGYHYTEWWDRWNLINEARPATEIFPDYERLQDSAVLFASRYLGRESIRSVTLGYAVPRGFSGMENGEVIPFGYWLIFQVEAYNGQTVSITLDSESGEFLELSIQNLTNTIIFEQR